MEENLLLKRGSTIHKICRYLIPAVYAVVAVSVFLRFDDWFNDLFGEIALFLDITLAASFLGLFFTAHYRTVKASFLLIIGCFIMTFTNYIFIKGDGMLMVLSYNGLFNNIGHLLFLAGIIVLISDETIRAKAPRLSLAYVFFQACCVTYSVLNHAFGRSMETYWFWDSSMPFLYINILFSAVLYVLAALFWFNILRGELVCRPSAPSNPLKIYALPATIIVILISSALIIII